MLPLVPRVMVETICFWCCCVWLRHVAGPSSTSCLRLSIVIDWGTRRTPVGRADDCGAQSGGLRARINDNDVYNERERLTMILLYWQWWTSSPPEVSFRPLQFFKWLFVLTEFWMQSSTAVTIVVQASVQRQSSNLNYPSRQRLCWLFRRVTLSLASAMPGPAAAVYVYVNVFVYVCACMHACMYVRMYECMYVCMHVCIYVCTYVCM